MIDNIRSLKCIVTTIRYIILSDVTFLLIKEFILHYSLTAFNDKEYPIK